MKIYTFVLIALLAILPVFGQDKTPPPPPQEVKVLNVKFTVTNEVSNITTEWISKQQRPYVQLSPTNKLIVVEKDEDGYFLMRWEHEGEWTWVRSHNGSSILLYYKNEHFRVKVKEIK